MSSVAIRLVELDTEASIIEAASKRVRLAVAQGSIVALGGVICVYLNRAQSLGNRLRAKLSEAVIQTAEDRAFMREIASNLGQAAQALYAAHDECDRGSLGKIRVVGPRLMAQLEHLASTIEDMAETAALAASQEFADTLSAELDRSLEIQRHAII